MSHLDVRVDIEIDRDQAVVRRQFGDVAHHERTSPHRGVRFEVIDDGPERCRYRQTTELGPARLHQEFVLPRTPDGPLVNTVIAGQFTGGSISFDVQPAPDAPNRSLVEARLVAELSGVQAVLAPILRRNVARALSRSLAEDKNDLENGTYSLTEPEPQQ